MIGGDSPQPSDEVLPLAPVVTPWCRRLYSVVLGGASFVARASNAKTRGQRCRTLLAGGWQRHVGQRQLL
jgi:hypothetical protein